MLLRLAGVLGLPYLLCEHLCTQQEETTDAAFSTSFSGAFQPSPAPLFPLAAWFLISDVISGACLSFILFTPSGDEFLFCRACRGACGAVRGADKHVRLMIAECFAAVTKRQLCKFLPVCPRIRRPGEAVTSTGTFDSNRKRSFLIFHPYKALFKTL